MYAHLSSSEFIWNQNIREQLNISKKALAEHSNVMTKLSRNNAFIEPIFRGCNVMVQLSEMVRRGTHAVLDSVQAHFPERNFLAESIEGDLMVATNAIHRLYTYGSHRDLFPDELEFKRYQQNYELAECTCGECTTSFRVNIDQSFVRMSRFHAPIPLVASRGGEAATSRAGSSETDPIQGEPTQTNSDPAQDEQALHSADQRLHSADHGVSGPSVHIDNYGGIRVRATRHYMPLTQGLYLPSNVDNLSGELVVDIPGNTPFNHFINRENTRLGRVSIAFNMGYLNSIMQEVMALDYSYSEEEVDYDDLQAVSIVMNTTMYNESVEIVKPVDADCCPICMDNMDTNELNLNSLCVRVKCCKKVFHDACLRHLVCDVGPPKCPMCRGDLRDFSETETETETG